LRRALAILLLCLVPLAAGCGGKSGGSGKSTSKPSLAGQKGGRGSGCKQVRAPHARSAGHEKKPKRALDASKKWSLVISTNCGSFTVALDLSDAPQTTASLVALAKSGFFDGTAFHRIVPGFVIQGGDPAGNGSGGPGYKVVEAPPKSLHYVKGVVAMAKTEIEDPGTSGSQFFVVTGPDAQLPADYALVGRVTSGIAALDRIATQPTNQSSPDPALREQPAQPVVIRRVTVGRR